MDQGSYLGCKMDSRCVWFLQILVAAYLVSTAAAAVHVAQRMPCARSTHCNQMIPYQNYVGGDWRTRAHHREEMVAGVSSKLFAQRSRSTDDQTPATSRHQLLQQTSTHAELQVLMAFKEGVINDSLGVLKSWNPNDTDACNWKGVLCTQGSKSIMALELASFGLIGTISPLLGRLTNLQTLDLSDNSFEGEIPTSLLNCSRLSYLALRNNNLTGQIPSHVGDLRHLQFLDLGENDLDGLIPASLSNCSLLGVLHLDDTSLSGEIPSSLGQLAHLESLNLTNTFNSGSIPKSLGNCSHLTELLMGNLYFIGYAQSASNDPEKELGGELPAELGQLSRLKSIGFGGTSIHGPFPAWIANLTGLTSLALGFNSFSGEIPEFLGMLPLEQIDLGGNLFSGTIPAAISNCSNLLYLGIYLSPNMSGAIPAELGMLSKLEDLDLSENSLTGTTPSSLSNCSALGILTLGMNPLLDPQPVSSWLASLVNLTYLYLSDMNLQGEIPISLGELSELDHLYLAGNQLTGRIPASLGNCTSLVLADLSENQLSTELPPEIRNLHQLQIFSVFDNLLTGKIPASIGNLSFLQYLDCSNNFFVGSIPSQVGLLQNLETAYFGTTNLDGSIPQSLGNCSALNMLTMSNSQLSGEIPDSLGNLTVLEELDLSANRLEGAIPVDLLRCTGLGNLDLSQNLLVGSIPQEIGQLVSLQALYLHNNKLTGDLPNSIGFLTSLLYLDISFNGFSGPVPGEAIANISRGLNSLNVSHNGLSGSLPSEIGKLMLVYNLDFSVNNFSGSIPSGLGNCKSVQRLDLSINNLSGGIPQALAHLVDLKFVNVSYNQLKGPLPNGGVFNSSNLTAASFLGNPGLCGSVLKGCPVIPSPGSASSCKNFRCGRDRTIIIAACAGTGIVLLSVALVVLICLLFYRNGKNYEQPVVTFATGLKVSEQELLSIIESPENMIGVGGTSIVYKGVLSGGRTVAIKALSRRLLNDSDDHEYSQQAATQFYMEAHTLSQLRHRNILKVLGLFSNMNIKALILEYMPKASLHQQLYDVEKCELTWQARLNIALGVAQGMVHLHSQTHEPVIHRDLKPSNVFLDANLEPKLGDFGISRFVNLNRFGDGEITASQLCGTFGYIPPEYAATAKASTKGDIYSYGVILLELLTRKHPIFTVADPEEGDLGLPAKQTRHLVDWVLELSSSETPLALVDPMLLNSENISTSRGAEVSNSAEQMKHLMQVGLLCTQYDPQSRPQMSDVLAMLMQIKERGSDPAHRPTVTELAKDITVWPAPRVLSSAGDSESVDQLDSN